MPNIQIANVLTAAQDFLDEMNEFDRQSARKPPDPVIVFAHDPVACACASYRIWKSNPSSRWNDLDVMVPAPEDIAKAEQLKRYYRERLIIESLTKMGSNNRSEFRRKLGMLVVNELPITNREIGMLHRLPYFYQEDLDIDAVVDETNHNIKKPFPNGYLIQNYTLIPLRRVLRSRNSGDYFHYWFKDTTYNHPHNLVVKADNPLMPLTDDLFKRAELQVNTRLYVRDFRAYHKSKLYYQLADLRLAN